MKVLHGPLNIAGIPSCLAKAGREIGIDARSYSLTPHPFGYPVDFELPTGAGRWRVLAKAMRFALGYHVFHLHFGQSLLGPSLADVRWLHRLGRSVFFHFHGCDLKDSKANIARYDVTACKECWPMLCSDNRDRAIETAKRYARAVFVSTPDLLEFYPDSIWLPQSVDLAALDAKFAGVRPSAPRGRDKVRIVHSPSSRTIKGTRWVIETIESLQRDRYPIELVLIENLPFDQAMRACLNADIAIDQLLIGWYPTYAVEMMAMRKPVVCFLRDDLVRMMRVPPPIVSANPHNLREVLVDLLARRDEWRAIGARGRSYVERHHDALDHARYLATLYRSRGPINADLRLRYLRLESPCLAGAKLAAS